MEGLTMEIELECPWCDDALRVAREDLELELRCQFCGVRFELAADRVTSLAAAA